MTTSPPPSGAEKALLIRRTQAVARLRHPNLVRLLPLPGGAGLQPILGSAHKLSDFTLPAGTFKRFDLEQVVRLLLDVLSGLSALHEVVTDGQAFVHGEVCPQNIYVDEHGTARLVPLMNAHLAPSRPEPNGYVAPERLLGTTPDARTDTFSVGVMLWEALAGGRLFPDPSLGAVLGRKPPPIQLSPRAAWARPLVTIAERAIAFEPTARFQSAHELSHAIAAAVAAQLASVDTQAWQEEAPTPVFQPRVHLATLRTPTPPPLVMDLATSPARAAAATAAVAAPKAVPGDTVSPTVDAGAEPPERSAGGRRGGAAVLAVCVLALGLGLGVSGLRHAPSGWRALLPARLTRAGESAPAAALRLPPPAAAQVPSTAPSAPARASASAAGSAAPDPSATPKTIAAGASAAAASPASARPDKPNRLAPRSSGAAKTPARAAKTSDYGI
jgi:eukaryotic-like serine/threonine-protein kinase